MISEGDIVLFRFPQTDLDSGKLRPALLLRKIPNEYGDWLVCMISSQVHHRIEELELIVTDTDPGFSDTGLKRSSLVRVSRIAVVDESIFEGKLGSLPEKTFKEIKKRLASWIAGEQ